MKKHLSFFSVVLMLTMMSAALSMLALPASAETEETVYGVSDPTTTTIPEDADFKEDFIYSIYDNKVSITKFNSAFEVSVEIPDTINGYPVIAIEENAFGDCTVLTGITIPSSVTSIGNFAFSGCTSLKSVEIAGENVKFGTDVFEDCESISSVNLGSAECFSKRIFDINNPWSLSIKGIPMTELVITSNTYQSNFANCISIQTLTFNLDGGNHRVSDGAFKNCTGITKIEGLSTVDYIGLNAFAGCTGLTGTLNFGATDDYSGIEIGPRAFEGCTGISAITFDRYGDIYEFAFKDCTALKMVTVNSGCDIGSGVFQNCTSLELFDCSNRGASVMYYSYLFERYGHEVRYYNYYFDGSSFTLNDFCNIFDGCDKVVVKCLYDSGMYDYVKQCGIEYKVVLSEKDYQIIAIIVLIIALIVILAVVFAPYVVLLILLLVLIILLVKPSKAKKLLKAAGISTKKPKKTKETETEEEKE